MGYYDLNILPENLGVYIVVGILFVFGLIISLTIIKNYFLYTFIKKAVTKALKTELNNIIIRKVNETDYILLEKNTISDK